MVLSHLLPNISKSYNLQSFKASISTKCFIAYCVWRVLCSWSRWNVFGLSMDNWLFDIYFVSCSEWLICQCVIFLYDIFQWSECVCGMISVVKHTEERRITSTHPTSHWANSVEPTVLHSSYRFTLFNFWCHYKMLVQ